MSADSKTGQHSPPSRWVNGKDSGSKTTPVPKWVKANSKTGTDQHTPSYQVSRKPKGK